MRRQKAELLVLSILLVFGGRSENAGQSREENSLQLGTSIRKTVGRGQLHRFSLALQSEEFAQVIVDQQGIDVIVRVTNPQGKAIGEFDSPNGSIGPETVSVVAPTAGTYFIDVVPFSQNQEVRPGAVEVRLATLRRATPPEVQAARHPEIVKARGIALLNSVLQTLPEVRAVPTRVRAQIQIAGLLQTVDETLVRRLVTDAASGIQEYIGKTRDNEEEYQRYNTITQLRYEALQFLGSFDPEVALTFVRSTQVPQDYAVSYPGQPDPELGLEMNLATQIATKDPGRAVQIAEETLGRGYHGQLSSVVTAVRGANPVLAARLAKTAAAKLQEENLLSATEAANTAANLLRLTASPMPTAPTERNRVAPLVDVPLLSEQEYQGLLTSALTQALSFSPTPDSPYSTESNAATSILNTVKTLPPAALRLSPASTATIEAKLQQLTQAVAPRDRLYQDVNSQPIDRALEIIAQAPREVRDSLYQQLGQRVAREGDVNRGRQILTEGMSNAAQRRMALNNLERQTINDAINKGRFDDAVQSIIALRTTNERANVIGSVVSQLERGHKKETVLSLLEQLRVLLGTSVVAANQGQMNALLQVASAFSRQGSTRGFEIVEPLLDQFNELSVAAAMLSGFGQEYYQDGELSLRNGNSIGNVATQLTQTIGFLALTDFDRARQDVDRIARPEVRLAGYIAMAQQTINPPPPRR